MTDYFAYNNQLPINYLNNLATDGWKIDSLGRPYLNWNSGDKSYSFIQYIQKPNGVLYNYMPSSSADELAHIEDELIEFGAERE